MGEICIPKVESAVFELGEKCFHEQITATTLDDGSAIPVTACVCGKPQVLSSSEVAIGQQAGPPPCMDIQVSYSIRVFLCQPDGTPIGTATMTVTNRPLKVPLATVPNIICFSGDTNNEVVKRKPLNIYFASVVPNLANPATGKLVVRVEKEYLAFKWCAQALICVQACPIDNCVPVPTPSPSPPCTPYTATTQCPDWCFDDVGLMLPTPPVTNPPSCTACPPVQTNIEPPIIDP